MPSQTWREKRQDLVWRVVRDHPDLTHGQIVQAVQTRASDEGWRTPPSEGAIHAVLMMFVREGRMVRTPELPGQTYSPLLYRITTADRVDA